MDSIVLFKRPDSSERMEEPVSVTASEAGYVVSHSTTPMSSGNGGGGTSAELAWELIDIFESGMFAFPIYDHDSARDIVRYLLDRGILEEEIADAIKDSAVDMSIWLEKGDKYMVGEWVIAWINACRQYYMKHKNNHRPTGTRRQRHGSMNGSSDSLTHQYNHMDDDNDDDDEGDCIEWNGTNEDRNQLETEDETERGSHRLADICSKSSSSIFEAVPSYSSGLSFNQGTTTTNSINDIERKCSVSSPSSPPTPFHRLAPFFRRNDHPGGIGGGGGSGGGGGATSAGTRRKAFWWRSTTAPSLQHLIQCSDEKSDSGIVSDLFDRISHGNDKEDCDIEEGEVEKVDSISLKSSLCNVIDASSSCRCTCRLPHYARYATPQSPQETENCANCGKQKDADSLSTDGLSPIQSQGQGHYYKDFIIRALEYTLESLDREGPGYLFILTDSEDRPLTWTHEKRYRVASSNHPELCLAAYRSRNIEVDLLWQVKVSHHNRMAAEVQLILEKHRLHSNWFKCTLNVVMETVYAVLSHHQMNSKCQTNEP